MIKQDEDSSYGRKLLRLFRLLLADRRPHYLTDLYQSLNCSPQTILRLMDEIEGEVGISLQKGKDGRRRWFKLMPLNRTGRLLLDNEDLRFLQICRDLADPYLPAQMKKRVDARLWELSLQLSELTPDSESDTVRFTFFSKGYIDYTPFYDRISTLLDASQEHAVCLVHYRPSGEEKIKEHYLVPYRIASMNSALYVLGTYVADDFMTPRHSGSLAVHRLLKVRKTGHITSFEPPQVSSNSFGLPWHEPRTFKIRFKKGKSADYVRERIWASHQRFSEDTDGHLILEITTTSEPELRSWVRSFGPEEAQIISCSSTEPQQSDKTPESKE